MASIYELTEAERATMKRLIDAGLVVTIGAHAKVELEREIFEKALTLVREHTAEEHTREFAGKVLKDKAL